MAAAQPNKLAPQVSLIHLLLLMMLEKEIRGYCCFKNHNLTVATHDKRTDKK